MGAAGFWGSATGDAILMSAEITQKMAHDLYRAWRDAGDQVGWALTRGTSDHGKWFLARPHVADRQVEYTAVQAVHLRASSIESLREMLPAGLVRFEPAPGDDPVIVEVWM